MGAVKSMMVCDECGQYEGDHMAYCKQMNKEEHVNDKWANGSTDIRPHHYTKYKIEPYTFFMENNLDMMTASVIKYTMRHADKNGVVDLNKAIKCLEMMREFYYNE